MSILTMCQLFTQPFGITWRKALLSAPRLVPNLVLYFTSPEGPHPILINIPSRGSHLIPLYVFIPPPSKKLPLEEIAWLPVLVDFHGGGFVFGSCQEQAPFCSKISRELNAICVSVDYRMGPASSFPTAVEDAEDAVNAILNPDKPGYQELRRGIDTFMQKSSRPKVRLDPSRIAVSGFSSGGNLALNLGLSIHASTDDRQDDWPSVFPSSFRRNIPLLLFFPSLDCRQLPHERPLLPGVEEKKSFLKSLRLEAKLMPTYLPREQAGHPRASPGLATVKHGCLHQNARILLILPELDTLGSQSDVWVQKVADEGRLGDLTVEKVKGVVHGWTQFPDSWLSEDHRKLKADVFDMARDFVSKAWVPGG